MERSNSGKLSYGQFTNKELRDFMNSRGIVKNFGKGKIGKRSELIAELEREDDDPKFHHFIKLPAELRNMVYTYYYAEFKDKNLNCPQQPPLTVTSRQIRNEALPLFYASCLFEFRYFADHPAERFRLPTEFCNWIHATKESDIARINRFVITGDIWCDILRMRFRIDFTKEMKNYLHIVSSRLGEQDGKEIMAERSWEQEHHLRFREPDNEAKLSKKLIVQFQGALEAYFRDHSRW